MKIFKLQKNITHLVSCWGSFLIQCSNMMNRSRSTAEASRGWEFFGFETERGIFYFLKMKQLIQGIWAYFARIFFFILPVGIGFYSYLESRFLYAIETNRIAEVTLNCIWGLAPFLTQRHLDWYSVYQSLWSIDIKCMCLEVGKKKKWEALKS